MKVTAETNKWLKGLSKQLPDIYKASSIKISGEKLRANGVDRDYIKTKNSYIVPNQQVKVDHLREMKNLFKKGGELLVLKYVHDVKKREQIKKIQKEVKQEPTPVKKKWFYYHKNKGAKWIWFLKLGICIRNIKESKFELTEAQKDGSERFLKVFGNIITTIK